jgi:hypothetical protein
MADEDKLADQNTNTSGAVQTDITAPNAARVWNYLEGGKDNFEADRHAVRQLEDRAPTIALIAHASRAFLRRVVQHLAKDAGIRQFIDIAPGIPTAASTHKIAQAIAPECRVVYVDNEGYSAVRDVMRNLFSQAACRHKRMACPRKD